VYISKASIGSFPAAAAAAAARDSLVCTALARPGPAATTTTTMRCDALIASTVADAVATATAPANHDSLA
jgi:hypothetical protein